MPVCMCLVLLLGYLGVLALDRIQNMAEWLVQRAAEWLVQRAAEWLVQQAAEWLVARGKYVCCALRWYVLFGCISAACSSSSWH